MKNYFKFAMYGACALATTTFASCSRDGLDTPNPDPNPEPVSTVLSGALSVNMTLDATKTYTLEGALAVKDGVKLTIPAGTRIEAKEGFGNYIVVEQGGQIFVNGTSSQPVVMTADKANAGSGYWGGLIINGKARISGDSSDFSQNTGKTEIDNALSYGGDLDNDNSGSITYLELLYTGAKSSASVEHNGLTLNAVGSGTTIENIYILESADDAIEFFGGSVNVRNILAVDCDDDMFDFTQGYHGTITNAYGINEEDFQSTEGDPRGIECDGNFDGLNPQAHGQTDLTIHNLTIQINSTASRPDESGDVEDIIKIRRGATANITNALAIGAASHKDIIDMHDKKGAGTEASVIELTTSLTGAMSGKAINTDEGTSYPNVEIVPGNDGCDFSNFAWTSYSGSSNATESLSGDITSTKTLSASTTYYLEGALVVKEGGDLIIPAGTTILAREGFGNYILVEMGGQIHANGTEAAPVTITADVANAGSGYWGGLIINGKAHISGASETHSANTGKTEIDNAVAYGGDVDDDNSGSITYLKLFYTGAKSSASVEHNGLTLNAVGSGTTIENVYVLESADDAIEFFGGSVNVTNFIAVDCDDDMFDFTQGYHGTITNCYGLDNPDFQSTEGDPRGIECDGNFDGVTPMDFYQTDMTINGMTLEFNSTDSRVDGPDVEDCIKIRRGSKANITNVVVKGSATVKDLVDVADKKGFAAAGTVISILNQLTTTEAYDLIEYDSKNSAGEAISADPADYTITTNVTANTGADTAAFAWTGIF